jgi:hypothetical protein
MFRKKVTMFVLVWILAGWAVLLGVPALASPTEFNISDYGGVGDGKADDTAAIRKAITAAGMGGTVRFPRGTYRISGTLELEGVHLLGNISGGFPSDASVMPIIVVTHTDGPGIRCGGYSSVHGLVIQYEKPNFEKPVKIPPAILLAGIGISISNVKISNSYDAIAADGKANIGRVNLENIFLPEVINTGVYLTKAYDIPTMRNVEVFCTNKYFLNNGVGFKMGRLDEFHAANCFVIGARTGFLFEEDKSKDGGATYGGLMDCSTDFCQFGYVITGGARIRVTNGSYLSHFIGFKIDDPKAVVIVDGAIIQANGDHIVDISDCGNVMISACRFQKAFENPKAYGAHITGGKNIIINGCTFDAFGPGVSLEGKVNKVTITNNIFEGVKFPPIVDKLPPPAKKVISNNQ